MNMHTKVDLSEEERLSFDINDSDQVAAFIQEAIEQIFSDTKGQRDPLLVRKTEAIVKGMLGEDFGPNLGNLPYRKLVMEYVTNAKNLARATETYSKIARGLETLTGSNV